MNGVKLEGLTLHVQDVEKSVEFYARIPGAEKLMHFSGKFAMFRFGEGRLGLVQAEKHGFHVELGTEKKLDEMYEAVLAAGFQPESPPTTRAWGRRDFILLDPDGNMLEFG
jgi:catechol 2,3-dioxygenase-like lactoylglutathione lyase family enzyme